MTGFCVCTKVGSTAVVMQYTRKLQNPARTGFECIKVTFEYMKPLRVLHCGSELSDNDFGKVIKRSVCKVYIFTDLDKADKQSIEEEITAGEKTLMKLFCKWPVS